MRIPGHVRTRAVLCKTSCVLNVEDINYEMVFIGTDRRTCNNAGGSKM